MWTLVLSLSSPSWSHPVLTATMALLNSERRSPLLKTLCRSGKELLKPPVVLVNINSRVTFTLLALVTVTEADMVGEYHVGENERDGQHGGNHLITLSSNNLIQVGKGSLTSTQAMLF